MSFDLNHLSTRYSVESQESSPTNPRLSFYLYNGSGNLVQEDMSMQDIQHFLLQNSKQQNEKSAEPRISDMEIMYQTLKAHMDQTSVASTTTTTTKTMTTTSYKGSSTSTSSGIFLNDEYQNILNRVQGIMFNAHNQNYVTTPPSSTTAATTTTTTKPVFTKLLLDQKVLQSPPQVAWQGSISDVIDNILARTNPVTKPPQKALTPTTTKAPTKAPIKTSTTMTTTGKPNTKRTSSAPQTTSKTTIAATRKTATTTLSNQSTQTTYFTMREPVSSSPKTIEQYFYQGTESSEDEAETQIEDLESNLLRWNGNDEHNQQLELRNKLSEDEIKFVDLNNEIGLKIFRAIKESSNSNLIFSPFSVLSFLSMIFLGSRGTTSRQIDQLLKLNDFSTFSPHLMYKNVTESLQSSANFEATKHLFIDEVKKPSI
jgi:hypothetical protein